MKQSAPELDQFRHQVDGMLRQFAHNNIKQGHAIQIDQFIYHATYGAIARLTVQRIENGMAGVKTAGSTAEERLQSLVQNETDTFIKELWDAGFAVVPRDQMKR